MVEWEGQAAREGPPRPSASCRGPAHFRPWGRGRENPEEKQRGKEGRHLEADWTGGAYGAEVSILVKGLPMQASSASEASGNWALGRGVGLALDR